MNEVIVRDQTVDLCADRPAHSFRESLELALRRIEDVGLIFQRLVDDMARRAGSRDGSVGSGR